MTQQWIRSCRVTVEGAGRAWDASEMRIRFKVEQNNNQRPNSCEVYISNLSNQTADAIKEEGKLLTLEVGYGGALKTLFKGDIIQKRKGRENPTDTYLAIMATSGDRAYNHGVVSKSLAAGHTFRDQVDACLEVMKPFGIVPGFIADLGKQKFPRGAALFGMARERLREIAFATGTSWSIQNNTFNMVKNDQTLPGAAIVLNSRTGMVGMPVQTMGGIMVRCLINPNIIPDSRIQIDEKSVQLAAFSPNFTAVVNNSMLPSVATDGFYKVLVVEHHGDTRGNPWYSDITCLRADGEGPIPLSLAARGVPNLG